MLQKIIKEYREKGYIIEVETKYDYKNKLYITEYWITTEDSGIKVHCIGEIGSQKDSAIICTIESCINEWIEFYEEEKERLEENFE